MKKLLFYASAVAVLFSSCSKDATEDIAVQAGTKVFSASIAMEDQDQTRLQLNGNTYIWEVNDAIGVGSLDAKGANILVTNTVNGANPSFCVGAEDYNRWLNIAEATEQANPLFVYFPYNSNAKPFEYTPAVTTGTKVAAKAEVELTIPAKQRYAAGTFYRNTVPAVGYLTEYTGADQVVELKVPTSLLCVKIAGFGEAEEVSMKIKKGDNSGYYNLAGTSKVNVLPVYESGKTTYAAYAPIFTEPAVDSKVVTVDFGMIPEELVYNGQVDIHFVIPAGLNLSEATLEFSIDDFATDPMTYTFKKAASQNASAYLTKPNVRTIVGTQAKPAVISFNMGNKFMVDSAEDFLAYAYLSRPGVAALAQKIVAGTATAAETAMMLTDYAYAAEMMGFAADAYDKIAAVDALVISDIDLANYGKDWADAKLEAIKAETIQDDGSDFWYNLLTWYKGNGYAIQPLSYNGVYGYSSDAVSTIKNVKVVGSGITAGASLANLKLENITVNANVVYKKNAANKDVVDWTSAENTWKVGLIAGSTNVSSQAFGASAATPMTIKNVIIGEGNVVNAGIANCVGGIYGAVEVKNANVMIASSAAITVNADEIEDYNRAVGRLYGWVDLPVELKLDGKYAWSATQTTFPVIGIATAHVMADKAQSTTMKNAGVVGSTTMIGETQPSPASVVVEGVSYWNGAKRARLAAGSVFSVPTFTAEELAFALSIDDIDWIQLTNNIDMQCDNTQKLVLDHSGNTISGSNFSTKVETSLKANSTTEYNVFEIKNVVADVKDGSYVASLFGNNASISNIILTNVELNVPARFTKVAGVAITGVANNVVVDDLVINVNKAAALENVGGVFATATDKSIAGAGVEVKSFKLNYTGSAKPATGVVAGTLNVELGKEPMTLGITKLTGAKSAYKTISNAQKEVKLANYADTKSYAYHCTPYGTVHVTNAAFASNGVVNAVLNANEASVGVLVEGVDYLAAGIVFTWDSANAAKQVSITEGQFKDYTVNTNKTIGGGAAASMFWGFTDKAPVAAN